MTANLFQIRPEPQGANPAFLFRDRPNLDSVLNPVPKFFVVNRHHQLVNSYAPGFLGGLQQYWDTGTVAVEWQKANKNWFRCSLVRDYASCALLWE